MLRNVKSKDLTPKCDLLKLSKERSVFRRFFNMIFYKKLGYLFLLLFTLVYGCGGGDGNGGDVGSEELAFQHIEEIMDKFHKVFDVYTDLSAAGNHFVTLRRMSSSGDEDKVEINPGSTVNCFSGVTKEQKRGQIYLKGIKRGQIYFYSAFGLPCPLNSIRFPIFSAISSTNFGLPVNCPL